MAGFVLKVVIVVIAAYITNRLLSHEDESVYPGLLSGKNVLLTGGSSGIGEEAAYYYAKLGANVVLTARRESLLQKVVKKCQELSPKGRFKYIVADFSKEDTPGKVVAEAVSFLGSLDYLLLNHAYLLTSRQEVSSWTGSQEQHDRLKYSVDLNFYSYVRTSDAALPHLKKTNGAICVISSMIILTPIFTLPYASSKSAMSIFFTGLRQELKHHRQNITITIVHLGYIPTDSSGEGLKSMSEIRGENLEEVMSILSSTTTEQCAADIVKAFTRREAEFYYPYNQMLWVARIITILSREAEIERNSGREFFLFIAKLKKLLSFS